MWKDRSVSLEPQAVLTHSPDHADPAAGHRSNFTIACYVPFVCNYSFWHQDSERKLWKILYEVEVFLFMLIILQELKNPAAPELLATLQRV